MLREQTSINKYIEMISDVGAVGGNCEETGGLRFGGGVIKAGASLWVLKKRQELG